MVIYFRKGTIFLNLKWIVLYLLVVNLVGAVVTAWDKLCAKKNAWRVPEKQLFLFCVLGGCPGVYGAMRFFRHKTLHKRFMWGIPAIFLLQVCIVLVLLWKFRFSFH